MVKCEVPNPLTLLLGVQIPDQSSEPHPSFGLWIPTRRDETMKWLGEDVSVCFQIRSCHKFLRHPLTPRFTIMTVPGPSLFTLRDTSQKVVRCHHKRLVASPQTANARPEKISVVPNQFMDPSHFPIIMGVDGGTRCLSCGTSAQPTLMLEDKKIMDLYKNSREAKRFTFTCSTTGSTHRFESVAFPGWYLSTSPRNDQPLRVTNRLGEAEITNFYFKKV
ncbi:hypothetical protein KIL84_011473 [Mauremys mutica]|uniref:Interleukin-1 n=1 Tax=Mauremys mutica TaxID=74926 RepID=A0A9D3XDP9_9SAUR|nr:hypothetical protein KIL84_011473 [Mauremys mutica]